MAAARSATALPPGYRLAWHDTIDSTNEEARRLAGAGERGPLWIVALRQTAGRGRRGRTWQTDDGNLAATLLFDPGCAPARAAGYSFAAALAVAELIDQAIPGAAQVKWPNDVLVGGRKIAGILLESAGGDRADSALGWLAIGIGVNLTSHPTETTFPATALAVECTTIPSVGEALGVLAGRLDAWIRTMRDIGFAPVREAWLRRAAGLGRPIVVRLGDQTLTGRFGSLAEDGALVLVEDGGKTRAVTAGEVFFGTTEPQARPSGVPA